MNKELENAIQLLRDYIKNHPEVLEKKEVDISTMSEEELRKMQEEELNILIEQSGVWNKV